MQESSKNIFWWLVNASLIVAVLVGLAGANVLRNQVNPQRTVTVLGEGKVTAVPDYATLTFSVVSEGTDPALLVGENADKMNRAIKFVKQQGIEDKDIKTAQYYLSPRYEYQEFLRRTFISGYTITQSVTVKVRDLAKAGPVLGGLPEFGVNQVSGPNFEIGDEERETLLAEAREQAFAKAREKAEAMAKGNGVRIRRVVTFSESGGPTPYFFKEALGARADAPVSLPVPTIEPGSQDVTVSVSVTYEIR